MSTPANALVDGYTVSEEEMNRLWRAKHAAALLAAFDNDSRNLGSISRDSLAAVAEYVADDMQAVLRRIEQRRRAESHPTPFQQGQHRAES